MVAIGATVVACSVRVDFGGTQYRCGGSEGSEGLDCPPGYECDEAAERCVLEGQGPDAGNGDSDGGVDTFACGEPALIATSFDQPHWALRPNVEDGGTVELQNGQLVMQAPPAAGDFAKYTDRYHTKLIGNRVSAEVVSVSGAEPVFEFWENDYLQLSLEGTNLVGRVILDGATTSGLAPYDPVAHRFWGLSESDGFIRTEVSPDGVNWTTLHERRGQLRDEFGHAELSIRSLGTPGTVVFDNLNGGENHATVTCGFDNPVEEFDDNILELGYSDYADECSQSITDGKLRWQHSSAPAATPFCAFIATYRVDFRNRSVGLETALFPAPLTGVNQVLNLEAEGGSANLFVFDNELIAEVCDPSCINLGSAVVDPVAHRFWRIRHDGSIHWEVSPDGMAWSSLGSVSGFSMNLASVEVEFRFDSQIASMSELELERFGPMP